MNQQISMLETVARVLSTVPTTIVFTGGATISLYLDEAAAPTFDLLMMLIVSSKSYPELNIIGSQTCCESSDFKRVQNQAHRCVAGTMRKFQLISCRAMSRCWDFPTAGIDRVLLILLVTNFPVVGKS